MFSSVLCSLLFALRTSLCTVQVGDVPKLMAKYKGKETALYAAMLKKYEINDVEDFFEGMRLRYRRLECSLKGELNPLRNTCCLLEEMIVFGNLC